MMKGRKPKDLAFKLLSGNPSKTPLNKKSQHAFVAGPVEKPDGLDKLASREWDRLATSLAPILCAANAGILLVAARNYSRMREADAVIAKDGETYKTVSKDGSVMIREHPMVGIGDRACIAYHRALAELGATPVGRTRVHKLPDADAQKPTGLEQLLG